MKAAPDSQLRLLDLQDHDTRLARLAARRRTLPALTAIADAEAALAGLRDTLVGFETESADQARAAARLETEIEQVRARADRDRGRLDDGTAAPKEMESLQSEIASLARRQSSLEDDELEILEAREQADHGAERTRTAMADSQERLAAAQRERDSESAGIDAETARLTGEREALAPQLPADLVALYDRLRADRGGVGVAALVARRCEGCHLELAGSDLSEVRSAAVDDVVRHDDCGRILVRTAASGL